MKQRIEAFIKKIIIKEVKKNLYYYAKQALIYGSCCFFVYKSMKFTWTQYVYYKWRKVCHQKNDLIEQKINKFKQGHMNDLELPFTLQTEIIQSSIIQLKQMLFDKRVTVKQILMAFINQTINFAKKYNLIMDVMFEEAFKIANDQDKLIEQDKNIIFEEGNELFGVPVSLKETLKLIGTDTTFGLASKCFNPDEEDGFQAYCIKKAGGIIFVKTSVPQGANLLESQNYIFGRASNPWDPSRSPGGSSSGEAGLNALRGTGVGIGSDLSGSIRSPAAFNGICAYKPSSLRNCNEGEGEILEAMRKRINIKSVQGPMGRYVDDLVQVSRVFLNDKKYDGIPLRVKDPYYYPYNFNEEIYKSQDQLRIGYFKSFQFIPACKANQRGVDVAIEALQKLGHEIVEFDLDEKIYKKLTELFYKFWMADSNMSCIQEVCNGEELIEQHQQYIKLANFPKIFLKIERLFYSLFNLKRTSFIYKIFSKTYSGKDLQRFHGQLQFLARKMVQEWENAQLDALIMPVSATVAFKHGQSKDIALSQMYTVIWNILDFSAGVVPVTQVNINEQFYKTDPTKYGRNDKFSKTIVEAMKNSLGLPVGVQVITLPHEDEMCLRVMKEIEQEVQFQVQPDLLK